MQQQRRRGCRPRPFGCFVLLLVGTLWIPNAIRVGVGIASQQPLGIASFVGVTGVLVALVIGRWIGRRALRHLRQSCRIQRWLARWQGGLE